MKQYTNTTAEAVRNVAVILGAMIVLAVVGIQHPAPWSPLGNASEQAEKLDRTPVGVKIPEGWKPAGQPSTEAAA